MNRRPKRCGATCPTRCPFCCSAGSVDKRFHNRGLGQALLRDAMMRAVTVSGNARVFAIRVHAISDQAKRFYLSRGFVDEGWPLVHQLEGLFVECENSLEVEIQHRLDRCGARGELFIERHDRAIGC